MGLGRRESLNLPSSQSRPEQFHQTFGSLHSDLINLQYVPTQQLAADQTQWLTGMPSQLFIPIVTDGI